MICWAADHVSVVRGVVGTTGVLQYFGGQPKSAKRSLEEASGVGFAQGVADGQRQGVAGWNFLHIAKRDWGREQAGDYAGCAVRGIAQ